MAPPIAGAMTGRGGDMMGGVWERYNIIVASGRLARRTLGLGNRWLALSIFFVFACFSLLFAALWTTMDLMSTWEWTSFLTPTIDSGIENMRNGVASVTFAALVFRIVLQAVSVLPTAFELTAPFFADQDDLFAGMFVIFSAFDLYTDWPKTSEMAGTLNYESWGQAAPLAQWAFTVILTCFFSFCVQYLLVLFIVIAACAAWVAVMGPRSK
ncbi:MAG: hypothetical protein WCG26_16515 [Chloroflexales bacterium]